MDEATRAIEDTFANSDWLAGPALLKTTHSAEPPPDRSLVRIEYQIVADAGTPASADISLGWVPEVTSAKTDDLSIDTLVQASTDYVQAISVLPIDPEDDRLVERFMKATQPDQDPIPFPDE